VQIYNYAKLFGSFINASQLIDLAQEPSDRQERKMLEEAYRLLERGWARRLAYLNLRAAAGEAFDEETEKANFYPKVDGGRVLMPLQYLQDYLVKKVAAIQNNTSIHNHKEVADLKEVFDDYGIKLTPSFKGLTLNGISWSAKMGQKPKLLVHVTHEDTPLVLRFEAASELCSKFLNVIQALELRKGDVFDLDVEAVDPAIEANKRAGKQVKEAGKYVNHNLTVTCNGHVNYGRPQKGTRFVQKLTIEQLEVIFQTARHIVDEPVPQRKAYRA